MVWNIIALESVAIFENAYFEIPEWEIVGKFLNRLELWVLYPDISFSHKGQLNICSGFQFEIQMIETKKLINIHLALEKLYVDIEIKSKVQ